MIDVAACFKKFNGEYLKFERVENPLHSRPDICAFLLLDKLVPDAGRDIINCAEHDQYWLDINVWELEKTATEQDIITLVRCGISYDNDYDSLYSFT